LLTLSKQTSILSTTYNYFKVIVYKLGVHKTLKSHLFLPITFIAI
jgi:hypothetical protein